MATCSAYGCVNRPSMKIPGVTFHKFPSDVEIKNKWVESIRRKDWVPSKNSHLCSEHFASDQFDHSSFFEVRLKESAVPTIFKAASDYIENLQNMDENSTEKKVPRVNITENKFSIDGVCAEMIVEVDDGEPVVSSSSPAKILTTTNQDGEIPEENATDPQKVNFAKTLGLICPSDKGEDSESALANDMPEVKTEIISDEFEMTSPTDSMKITPTGKDLRKKKKKHRSVFFKNFTRKKKSIKKIQTFEILPGQGIPLGEIDHIFENVTSPKVSGLKPLYRVLFNIWPLQDMGEIKEQILEFSGFPFDESSDNFKKRKQTLKMLSMISVQNISQILGLRQEDRLTTMKKILKFLSKPHDKFNVDPKMLPDVLLKRIENDSNLIKKEVNGYVTYVLKKMNKKEIKKIETEKKGVKKAAIEKNEIKKVAAEKKEDKKVAPEKKEVKKVVPEKKVATEKKEIKKVATEKKEVKKSATEKKEVKKVVAEKEKKDIKSEAEKKDDEVKIEKKEDKNLKINNENMKELTIQPTLTKHGRIRKEKQPYSPPERDVREESRKSRGRPAMKKIEQRLKIKFSPKKKLGRPFGTKKKIHSNLISAKQSAALKSRSILKSKAQRENERKKEVNWMSNEFKIGESVLSHNALYNSANR